MLASTDANAGRARAELLRESCFGEFESQRTDPLRGGRFVDLQ